jgi:hypothetical protein
MPKRLDGMPAWNVPVNPVTSRAENTGGRKMGLNERGPLLGEADKRSPCPFSRQGYPAFTGLVNHIFGGVVNSADGQRDKY